MTNLTPANAIANIRDTTSQANRLIHDLLFIKGLYQSISLEGRIGELVQDRLRNSTAGNFDCYCVTCKKETSFIISPLSVHTTGGGLRDGNELYQPKPVFGMRAVCQRDLTSYVYTFRIKGQMLIKIGQEPSMADIAFGELKDFDKNLDAADRKELGKALGLFAHDAASGAFVYLRRVFERMIRRAHDRMTSRTGSIVDFEKLRMDEKISALKDELPERLVRNKSVFTVLSAGIHELTDEQCTLLFPVVKAVIFQMLEQEEHKRQQAIAERETDSAFAALLSSGVHMGSPSPGDQSAEISDAATD